MTNAPALQADPVQAARLAALLAENARLYARTDPAFAGAMSATAAMLNDATKPRRTRAVAPAQKRAAATRAATWMSAYHASLPPGSAPPSDRAIIHAARDSGIPRRILLAARPPEWVRQ